LERRSPKRGEKREEKKRISAEELEPYVVREAQAPLLSPSFSTDATWTQTISVR